MNLIKKHINKVLTGITGAITLDSYRRLLENDYVVKKTNDLLEESVRRSIEITDKLEELSVNTKNIVEVESKLSQLKDNLDNVLDNTTKLGSVISKDINSDVISKDLTESVNKTSSILDEIIKLISDTTSGTSSLVETSNNISLYDIYNQYINFLSTLTTIQVGAIAYILVSILIIYLLINILLIFYGDKLITYFEIELRYPKITKIIKLRRKFQDYYILSNSLIAILLLIYVIYINVLIIYHIFL